MICFKLQCANDHHFDSWFASGAAFDGLAGQLSCPLCGDTAVTKALMTPAVRPAEKTGARPLTQRRYRGFSSRKFRHHYYARKAYVAAVLHKGEAMRKSITRQAQEEDWKRRNEEEEKAREYSIV